MAEAWNAGQCSCSSRERSQAATSATLHCRSGAMAEGLSEPSEARSAISYRNAVALALCRLARVWQS